MFNVGDLVIGNHKNGYSITCKGSICLVLGVDALNHSIRVCVICDVIDQYCNSLDINPKHHTADDKFWVNADEFDLFTGSSPNAFLSGVFFRKDVKKLVTLKNEYVGVLNLDKYIYIGEV